MAQDYSELLAQHRERIETAVKAIHDRSYYAAYSDHPKAYKPGSTELGKQKFDEQVGQNFEQLLQEGASTYKGEEVSPFTQEELGIKYPIFSVDKLVTKATQSWASWKQVKPAERAAILTESLERMKIRFFEIAYATQHTTGQSWIMSFQASGPHAADRAMEAIALGYHELQRFPETVNWQKPMGGTNIEIHKTFKAIPKGVALVIGCSTFPTWNSMPGMYASLITGNPVIVKPHPKAVWPIAIVIAELQHLLQELGLDPNTIQLAADSFDQLLAVELAEHEAVKIIDYTGGSSFGDFIESLRNKTVFTEKSGINSVIVDSAADLRLAMRNQAFCVSLYSGQMCTAPQNYFIPEGGIPQADGSHVSYEDAVGLLKNEIASMALNPKMAGALGTIQNPATALRAESAKSLGTVVLNPPKIKHAQFENARVQANTVVEVDASQLDAFGQELFGPVVLVVKTRDTEESVRLVKQLIAEHGAITCSLYCIDAKKAAAITEEMNEVFAPVSLNFTGFAFVNQHAAFSDFHVTGGNSAGNACFTNPEYLQKRFVWVGNRMLG